MNRVLKQACMAAEGLVLIGAAVLEILTRKYMTMMRIMLYKNRMWSEMLPMDALMQAGTVLLAVMGVTGTVLLFMDRRRSRNHSGRRRAQQIGFIALCGIGAGIAALNSVQSLRAYYVVVPSLMAAAILQGIRVYGETRKEQRHGAY